MRLNKLNQKKYGWFCVVPLLSSLLLSGCTTNSVSQKQEELTVYTAVETDQLSRYQWALKKAHPELKIKWVRDSTGIVTAKLLAEKNKPQADVVMGLALTSLLVMDQENLLHPYRPKNIEALKPNFYSQKTIPTWTGMTAWESALCVNTVELKKRNLPVPQSWQDLTKAQYKDLIVMPNPASSGTGYLDVTAWIQIFGEQKAWPYMKDLDRNISQYVHSGSKPCKMAAQGEAVIGISFGYPGLKLQAQGAPLELVYPKEGLGWEMEASAIVKGTKHLSSAQKFIDWTVSEEANELYAQNFGLVAHQKVKPQHKGMPVDLEEKLIPHNFDWAAQQRDSILKRWSAQFEH
ncbi:putative 2-aminoethylphosphonate ABC transporter substrate-binding protein [Acinetobacter portensis]|uniref:2-aminoethylphosphonate ABC transporter substrate-binding protein n=2 Tax=Acinetobacter TaxID=469 RepID=A0AB35UXR1_9GAMM|nr:MULTISPECIES: putative 2-aminoethylphosphonate ABC transporter substrate-binding protein [Acinetobacter]MCK7609137.1 putative 2-aminoethylphosphonate ABC transporter substrate-binding protein [Acinetobacter portensis]MCK7639271.1 putative 2-aminoethylphosphonate ABC transporter substrate-binding protein [Acinetobacter portensis]MDY6483813.1 putative 2-aminoethylphosphonate ABC transporter substrate-binding protein [Acinetobacter faecalis]MDY6487449.1 putative 2-aminoethylphosphonate ABC tran